jgi:hypothetical protein
MHNLQCQRPCSALSALIRVYAQRELGPPTIRISLRRFQRAWNKL